MLLQLAFVLLCLAQIIHFSSHWLVLTRRMKDARDARALTAHLDWTRQPDRRRARQRGWVETLLGR